ncbi:UNVERIFIED_CONTAM: hypothetical protein Slati_0948500 [Sesamum latifolium]|uniref:Uncharacterized protein n=1 Tax=Sesamum latifolium TaxID=2727402 RepID=A0AAW2XQH0_9LAMI
MVIDRDFCECGFLNGTLFGVYEPIRRLPSERGGEPLHLLEAFRRVVVCDWIEPEQQHRLCYKCRWLRFFRVKRERPDSGPPINAEPRVNLSASSHLEAGMDPPTNADPAMAGVKCRCLCWKQCCPCFKCRWLRFFRVEREPGSSPPINVEPRVNPSASSDLEAGMDPATNADPTTAGVKCRCLCWKQCCPCFKCRWLCCFRVDQEPHASPLINAESSVNRSTDTDLETGGDRATNGDPEMTGVNAAIDDNPATNMNMDTNVNRTTVVDQAIGAAPVTNVDPSAPADQANRRGSRLSNLRSRIRLRRGVGREMSEVGLRIDVKKMLHSFRSVMDLKAKGIEVEPSSSRSLKDVKFKSKFFCTQLKLPTWFVSIYTKIFFLNMIAFELSLNNFNNHMVTSYINLMKSLIESPEDVRELREKKILFNLLGTDKQVLQVYKDINTYGANNPLIFRNVKDKIQAHHNSKMKTWIAVPASSQPTIRPVHDQASSHPASSRSAIRLARGLASSHPASSQPAIWLARDLRAGELAPSELVAGDPASSRDAELSTCELVALSIQWTSFS